MNEEKIFNLNKIVSTIDESKKQVIEISNFNDSSYNHIPLENAKNRCLEFKESLLALPVNAPTFDLIQLTKEDLDSYTYNSDKLAVPYIVQTKYTTPEFTSLSSTCALDFGFSYDRSLDFTFGQVIGIILGDGWWDHKDYGRGERHLYIADLKGYNANYVLGFLTNELNVQNLNVKIHEDRKEHDSNRYGDCNKYIISFLGSTGFTQWLNYNFGGERTEDSAGSKNKRVAEWVFKSPLDFQLGILNGLMTTDGTICIAKTQIGNLKERIALNISSASPHLMKSLERICLNLGIKFKTTFNKITIRGNTAYTFAPNIVDCRINQAFDNLADIEKRNNWLSVKVEVENPACKRYDSVAITDMVADVFDKVVFKGKRNSIIASGTLKKKLNKLSTLSSTLCDVKKRHLVSRHIANQLLNAEHVMNVWRNELFKEHFNILANYVKLISSKSRNFTENEMILSFDSVIDSLRMLVNSCFPLTKYCDNERVEVRKELSRKITTLTYRNNKNIQSGVNVSTLLYIMNKCVHYGSYKTAFVQSSELVQQWKRDIVDNTRINWDILAL